MSASTPSAVDWQRPNFSICSNVKTNKKSTFSGEMLSIGISYAVTASICSEKTHLKNDVFNHI